MGYIAIVDYGAGNLMSVHNTLDYLGYENKIAASADVIENAAGVILPGVGAFPDAMAALTDSGLTEAVLKAAKEKPFLGICLGMQMLFEESDEVRLCRGLGLLPGRIERIETSLKLPQIGWNALDILRPNAMTEGLENGSYVYFVHSFMAHPADENDLAAVTDYGTRVPAMVAKGNLFGCQFHPEKSGALGLKLLETDGGGKMRVIPAIDLKDGQCVRLQKGDYGTAHKVAENPVETAQRFLDAGADLVHMVDLDAAKDGSHANYGVVEQVIRETGATVELGGGIRSMQDVETVIALGVSRVIIGSAAVRDLEFVAEAVKKYGDKIVVGIDAKSETVRTDGWLGDSGENYIAFAERMESIGVRHIIFTDIDKDGMLAGPNFDQLAALRASVSCEIIASGGVSTLEDITGLKKLGIDGAIAGKAVYTGTLDLKKAISEAK